MARPRSNLPVGSREIIMAQAESGCLQETKVARALGLSLRVFRRIRRDNDDAAQLWEEALATERDALLSVLHGRAREGDVKAAQYLLAARHGMREDGGDSGQKGGDVTIQLPAAMSMDQWRRFAQVEQSAPALEGGSDG